MFGDGGLPQPWRSGGGGHHRKSEPTTWERLRSRNAWEKSLLFYYIFGTASGVFLTAAGAYYLIENQFTLKDFDIWGIVFLYFCLLLIAGVANVIGGTARFVSYVLLELRHKNKLAVAAYTLEILDLLSWILVLAFLLFMQIAVFKLSFWWIILLTLVSLPTVIVFVTQPIIEALKKRIDISTKEV